MRHGFDLGYKTLVHNSKPALLPPPPIIDNTRQPQMSDMPALLNDLSYIPPNNKHNEPTRGDIGETSNELTQATRNEFEELYDSSNDELYPGCDYVTRLDFMANVPILRFKSSTNQEYPSLIDTFFVAHTVNGEFLRDEDRRIYEEMRRLEATGTYTDDEINRLARGGKQRGHIPDVGRVLPARATASPNMLSQFESGDASGSGGCEDNEEGADHQDDEDVDGDCDT
nr:F-box domain, leucine-rich repeat domain, L domain-like protein [Tanacetum cinerariifolium]